MTTITTNAPTTTSALEGELRSLEDLDNAVVGHFLDLNQCLIEYRQHGLSGSAIGKRVRELGAQISDSQVRRRLQDFKMPKPVSDKPEAVKSRKRREKGSNAQNAQMTPTSNPTPANSNDQQQVRLLQSPDDSCSVVEPEIVTDLQMGGPEVDIRSFTPVLEQLLFGIEAARRNSANTAEEWGSLSAMLQTLYHHAQCESKQRRLRRDRETAE